VRSYFRPFTGVLRKIFGTLPREAVEILKIADYPMGLEKKETTKAKTAFGSSYIKPQPL
jgi:hypothetical protein